MGGYPLGSSMNEKDSNDKPIFLIKNGRVFFFFFCNELKKIQI